MNNNRPTKLRTVPKYQEYANYILQQLEQYTLEELSTLGAYNTYKLVVAKKAPKQYVQPTQWNTVFGWVVNYFFDLQKLNPEHDFNQADKTAEMIVYGIYLNNKVQYIGKTSKGLEVRKQQHLLYLREPDASDLSQRAMYEALSPVKDDLTFEVLYKGTSEFEVQYIEKLLIQILQPPYNKQGVNMAYHYRLPHSLKEKPFEIDAAYFAAYTFEQLILLNDYITSDEHIDITIQQLQDYKEYKEQFRGRHQLKKEKLSLFNNSYDKPALTLEEEQQLAENFYSVIRERAIDSMSVEDKVELYNKLSQELADYDPARFET